MRGTLVYNEKSVSLALSIDKKGEVMGGTHDIEFVKGQTLTHMATWEEEVDRGGGGGTGSRSVGDRVK
jgi:hypothetical protein